MYIHHTVIALHVTQPIKVIEERRGHIPGHKGDAEKEGDGSETSGLNKYRSRKRERQLWHGRKRTTLVSKLTIVSSISLICAQSVRRVCLSGEYNEETQLPQSILIPSTSPAERIPEINSCKCR